MIDAFKADAELQMMAGSQQEAIVLTGEDNLLRQGLIRVTCLKVYNTTLREEIADKCS